MLRTRRRIEISLQESRKIAGDGCREQEALRKNTSRGKDADAYPALVPPFQCGRHILEYFAVKLAALVSLEPDFALKLFKGRRFAILIHQPLMSGLSGQATDIDIHAREILRMREIMNQIMSSHTGQKLDKVEKDVERDFIMNAQQAKDYGIVDDIIFKHK